MHIETSDSCYHVRSANFWPKYFREARDEVKLVVEALLACSFTRDVFRWQGAWIVRPETLAYLLEINIEVSATLPEAL